MDVAGRGSGSHCWGWNSWNSSHEDGAAEHNDFWNQWESWNGDRKSGAAEHGDSWHELSSWNSGCKEGAREHDESWDAQNSWNSCGKSGAPEHDDPHNEWRSSSNLVDAAFFFVCEQPSLTCGLAERICSAKGPHGGSAWQGMLSSTQSFKNRSFASRASAGPTGTSACGSELGVIAALLGPW